ncbi:glutathione S-transferase [Serratia sp. Leaf50]|nr:glutathione S-transferase [Serratia sp. Leaf50]
MLKIWGRKTSSNVQALMWCVGELNLPYERYDIGHRFGGNDTPEFLAMNPNGTVPVLQDGDDEPLWETGAILRYIARVYGNEAFWPSSAAECAQVDKWTEWAKVSVSHSFTAPLFWRVVRTASKDRDQSAIDNAMKVLNKFLDVAEVQLSNHAYIAGEGFTLADVQFGHILYRYFDIDIERESFPALEQYYERLKQRPAFVEHVMVSYDDLRVK